MALTLLIEDQSGFPPRWISKHGVTSRVLRLGLYKDGVLIPWGSLAGPGGTGAPKLIMRKVGDAAAAALTFDLSEEPNVVYADDVTFVSTFSTELDPDAEFSLGGTAGSLIGNARVFDGVLELDNPTPTGYCDYLTIGAGSTAVTNRGCIRITIEPDYTGNPSNHKTFVSLGDALGTSYPPNSVALQHLTNGTLRMFLVDENGSQQVTQTAWAPTAGQVYELEANWDTYSGDAWLGVHGTIVAASHAITNRVVSTGYLRIGADGAAGNQFSGGRVHDVAVFNVAQHKASDTAPVGPPPTSPSAVGQLYQTKRIWAAGDFTSIEADAEYLIEVDAQDHGKESSFPSDGYAIVKFVSSLN